VREELYFIQKGLYTEMLPALEPLTEALIVEAAEQLNISSGKSVA
jgi:hypothetical protein